MTQLTSTPPTSAFAIVPEPFETVHVCHGDVGCATTPIWKTVPLASVIHALHRPAKDVIKAQLCQDPDRLIYLLTLLGRDGKVKRTIVDATSGAVVGER